MKTLKVIRSNSLIIYMLVFSLLIAGKAFAATYYVSPSGNDSNSGSISAPFKTIQKAANIVNPGDTVIVRDGTYTDTDSNNYIVKLSRGGTSSNWITFKSENKWGAVLDGQNNTTGYGWALTAGSQYVRIEGFEVKGVRSIGFHIPTNSEVNNIVFYGNKIHDVARHQILCTDPTIYIGRAGIFAGKTTSNITVDSNVIYNIGRLAGGCPSQPNMEYAHDHGIYTYADYSTIINNIFYDNEAGWAIQSSNNVTNSEIVNNTFYGANPYYVGHIIIMFSSNAITIENNISHNPKDYFIRDYASDFDRYWGTNISIKNNLVYGANGSMYDGVINYDNTAGSYTITGNITGQDPQFVNLANQDFHLQAASPAIDEGIYSGRSYDADGNPIIGVPDIGAYEYQGPQYADSVPPSTPLNLR